MKKLFLSLSIVSSLFFVSCEDEFSQSSDNNQKNQNGQEESNNSGNQGYWDITCDQRYEVVYVESCDSVWVSDNETKLTVCDSIIVGYTPNQVPIWGTDCDLIDKKNTNNGYYEVICQSVPQEQLVEVCDSVWIEQSDNTDSIEVETGNGNNQGNLGQECDTVITPDGKFLSCDSVWLF